MFALSLSPALSRWERVSGQAARVGPAVPAVRVNPGTLAKRSPLDSFSLQGEGGRRPDEGERRRMFFCKGHCSIP
jgi:hypothetical protein